MRTTFETRVGHLSCEVTGRGRPLLLLHANPGDSRDYEAVVPALSGMFRVHALDWPGYGLSAANCPDDLSASAYADALEDVVEALDPGPLALLGNSVGGFAAARLAARQPARVAALVLVNSGGFTRHTPASRSFCRLLGLPRVNRMAGRRLAGHYLHVRTPASARMLERAAARRQDPIAARVSAALWRSFLHPDHDLRSAARAVVAPTLLCWGRHDFLLPLATDGRTAERCIPGARLIAFDTGHAPFAEAPDAFLAATLPFLRQHLGSPSGTAPPEGTGAIRQNVPG